MEIITTPNSYSYWKDKMKCKVLTTVAKLKPNKCLLLLFFISTPNIKQNNHTQYVFGPVPYPGGMALINCIFLLFFFQYTKWSLKETGNQPIYIKMEVCHLFPLGEALPQEAESLTHSVSRAKVRAAKEV